jgi:hypothetical protein
MQGFFIWQNIVLAVVIIWLAFMSSVLYKIFALFNKLTKDVHTTDLKSVLEKVMDQGVRNQKIISELSKNLNTLETQGKLHVQKVGLVRFNPFKELGGDHSFSLAILNGENTGVIITSLHTRDRTRVYMKDIVSGKSETELSVEEIKALAKAR